jgi:hypothetical protein
MIASNLPAFHRWLMAGEILPAPSIVLYGFPDLRVGLGAMVAGYLNEFDDDAAGNWSAFAPELILAISETATQRNLLGLGEACKNCPPTGPCGRRKVLAALAGRGRAVLEGALAVEACAMLPRVFRVSLGPAPEGAENFHLVLRPELFTERSMPAIIGDTYLEWATSREVAGAH